MFNKIITFSVLSLSLSACTTQQVVNTGVGIITVPVGVVASTATSVVIGTGVAVATIPVKVAGAVASTAAGAVAGTVVGAVAGSAGAKVGTVAAQQAVKTVTP